MESNLNANGAKETEKKGKGKTISASFPWSLRLCVEFFVSGYAGSG
jgi:hypothetical protein